MTWILGKRTEENVVALISDIQVSFINSPRLPQDLLRKQYQIHPDVRYFAAFSGPVLPAFEVLDDFGKYITDNLAHAKTSSPKEFISGWWRKTETKKTYGGLVLCKLDILIAGYGTENDRAVTELAHVDFSNAGDPTFAEVGELVQIGSGMNPEYQEILNKYLKSDSKHFREVREFPSRLAIDISRHIHSTASFKGVSEHFHVSSIENGEYFMTNTDRNEMEFDPPWAPKSVPVQMPVVATGRAEFEKMVDDKAAAAAAVAD